MPELERYNGASALHLACLFCVPSWVHLLVTMIAKCATGGELMKK